MLSRIHRITRTADFKHISSIGEKIYSESFGFFYINEGDTNFRCGLIVSKKIGNSVVRHHVSRLLRHVVAANSTHIPSGCAFILCAFTPIKKKKTSEIELEFQNTLKKIKKHGT